MRSSILFSSAAMIGALFLQSCGSTTAAEEPVDIDFIDANIFNFDATDALLGSANPLAADEYSFDEEAFSITILVSQLEALRNSQGELTDIYEASVLDNESQRGGLVGHRNFGVVFGGGFDGGEIQTIAQVLIDPDFVFTAATGEVTFQNVQYGYIVSNGDNAPDFFAGDNGEIAIDAQGNISGQLGSNISITSGSADGTAITGELQLINGNDIILVDFEGVFGFTSGLEQNTTLGAFGGDDGNSTAFAGGWIGSDRDLTPNIETSTVTSRLIRERGAEEGIQVLDSNGQVIDDLRGASDYVLDVNGNQVSIASASRERVAESPNPNIFLSEFEGGTTLNGLANDSILAGETGVQRLGTIFVAGEVAGENIAVAQIFVNDVEFAFEEFDAARGEVVFDRVFYGYIVSETGATPIQFNGNNGELILDLVNGDLSGTLGSQIVVEGQELNGTTATGNIILTLNSGEEIVGTYISENGPLNLFQGLEFTFGAFSGDNGSDTAFAGGWAVQQDSPTN